MQPLGRRLFIHPLRCHGQQEQVAATTDEAVEHTLVSVDGELAGRVPVLVHPPEVGAVADVLPVLVLKGIEVDRLLEGVQVDGVGERLVVQVVSVLSTHHRPL